MHALSQIALPLSSVLARLSHACMTRPSGTLLKQAEGPAHNLTLRCCFAQWYLGSHTHAAPAWVANVSPFIHPFSFRCQLISTQCLLQYPRPVYVGADLATCTLQEALQGTGFDAGSPALFICEGLLYYLPEVRLAVTYLWCWCVLQACL